MKPRGVRLSFKAHEILGVGRNGREEHEDDEQRGQFGHVVPASSGKMPFVKDPTLVL